MSEKVYDLEVSFKGEGLKLDTAEDAEVVCRKLSEGHVKTLNLEGNTIGVEAAQAIGQALTKQKFLRHAKFKDIFTSRGRTEVPIALKYLLDGVVASGTDLTVLDLSDNAIGPIGAPCIFEFLKSSSAKKLEMLYMDNCGLGPEGSSLISVPISELRLREFTCGRNRLEDKGATFMSAALSQMRKLEVLKMYQNGIRTEGIAMIGRALLKHLKTIRVLDLSDNTLKVKGSEALVHLIEEAENLQELKLDDVLLGNEGFSVICDAINRSKHTKANLSSASFEGNELRGNPVIDLIETTFSNCNQGFSLNLLDNDFSKKQLLTFKKFEDVIEVILDDPDDKESMEYSSSDEEIDPNDSTEESGSDSDD